jgi:hypothetical protein
VKNRIHTPAKTKTLRQICEEGSIPFPVEEPYHILVETGKEDLEEPIVRNFPKRSYSTRSANPQEIVDLLAYEAHEWQAWEIQRQLKKPNRILLT